MNEEIKYYPVGGFAPGDYENRCTICQARFQGDKKATHCEPCGTRLEILDLRDDKKKMEFEILSFRKNLDNYKGEFWSPGELKIEYDKHFAIITNKEGKI